MVVVVVTVGVVKVVVQLCGSSSISSSNMRLFW